MALWLHKGEGGGTPAEVKLHAKASLSDNVAAGGISERGGSGLKQHTDDGSVWHFTLLDLLCEEGVGGQTLKPEA